MTILDKMNHGENGSTKEKEHIEPKKDARTTKKDQGEIASSASTLLTEVESQFKNMMAEFQASKGFSVNTGEQPVDTTVEVLSSKDVVVSIAVLLSYIRHCVNNGIKKDITVKIGYNRPPSIPMNFAINEELLGDIYPGDVVEIN